MTATIENASPRTETFEELRRRGGEYTDKTEGLFWFTQCQGEVLTVRAPEGSGKTFLISTLKSLFEHGTEHFDGLAIEKLWKDKERYSVVTLDFAALPEVATAREFNDIFEAYVKERFLDAGIKLESVISESLLTGFDETFSRIPDFSVVLLVDNFIAPVTRAAGNIELMFCIQQKHAEFLETFKDPAQGVKLRFFLKTEPDHGFFDHVYDNIGDSDFTCALTRAQSTAMGLDYGPTGTGLMQH